MTYGLFHLSNRGEDDTWAWVNCWYGCTRKAFTSRTSFLVPHGCSNALDENNYIYIYGFPEMRVPQNDWFSL